MFQAGRFRSQGTLDRVSCAAFHRRQESSDIAAAPHRGRAEAVRPREMTYGAALLGRHTQRARLASRHLSASYITLRRDPFLVSPADPSTHPPCCSHNPPPSSASPARHPFEHSPSRQRAPCPSGRESTRIPLPNPTLIPPFPCRADKCRTPTRKDSRMKSKRTCRARKRAHTHRMHRDGTSCWL